MKNTLKSIGAVLAGFLTVAILSVLTDFVLEKMGILPAAAKNEYGVSPTSGGLLFVALIYRSTYTIIGGYVCAKLAPGNPMRQVYILAALGFLSGSLGAIAAWDLSAHWYPLAVAVTGPLFVILGGKLHKANPA